MSDPKDEFTRIVRVLQEADEALVRALEARASAMRQLVELRASDPEGYYVPPRDEEIIQRARGLAKEFPQDAIAPVLREVLAATDAIAGPRTVAYLGPEGGFGHVAARRHFGAPATLRAGDTIEEVLEEVTRQRVHFGVVPLETSSEGAITATLHGLAESDVRICAEHPVASSHHLFSQTGQPGDVEAIHGTAPAIAACERTIRSHFPRASLMDVPSTEAAALQAREDHRVAALGTDLVGELYGLETVRERMEDVHGIEIRFAIVGNDLPPRTGSDRTVLALAVQDTPGQLYQALQPFANRGINLTRIESRPAIGKPWKYLFFVEMDGHVTERPLLTAIDELRNITQLVKILGSHPKAA